MDYIPCAVRYIFVAYLFFIFFPLIKKKNWSLVDFQVFILYLVMQIL